MLRLILRLSLGVTVILLLPLTLMRAQPPRTGDVRALLAAMEDCEQPCFMGIRPGVTTLDEAKALLQAHPWFHGFDATSGPNVLYIRWHESFSPLANRSALSSLSARDNTVESMVVTTSIPFLEIWGNLGPPDWGYGRPWGGGYTGIEHTIGYEDRTLMLRFYVPPVHWAYGRKWQHLSNQDVTLYLSTAQPILTFDNPSLADILRGAIRLSAVS